MPTEEQLKKWRDKREGRRTRKHQRKEEQKPEPSLFREVCVCGAPMVKELGFFGDWMKCKSCGRGFPLRSEKQQ